MPIEARDASGRLERSHVEVIVAHGMMMPALWTVGWVTLGAAVLMFMRGGALAITGGVVCSLVAIVALGSAAASVWGRYVGLPWLFTPLGGKATADRNG